MALDGLLSRLDGVRHTGPSRWLAKCPAHKDRSPSLAIREVNDGRILMHCFAGCETDAVLAAAGLSFSDLFPEAVAHHVPPVRRPFNASDVLVALSLEVAVVSIMASDISAGRAINRDRLRLAVQRICTAVEMCHA